MVSGLARRFNLTFSSVTRSSLGDTRAFPFSNRSCLFDGMPILNDAKR